MIGSLLNGEAKTASVKIPIDECFANLAGKNYEGMSILLEFG
jgi:hypothetical protein